MKLRLTAQKVFVCQRVILTFPIKAGRFNKFKNLPPTYGCYHFMKGLLKHFDDPFGAPEAWARARRRRHHSSKQKEGKRRLLGPVQISVPFFPLHKRARRACDVTTEKTFVQSDGRLKDTGSFKKGDL